MPTSQPTPSDSFTAGSFPEPISGTASANSSKSTASTSIKISKATRPLNFIGQIISPSSNSTIPINIPTTISETLVTISLENLDNHEVLEYLSSILLKFEDENSAILLKDAKKDGLNVCIACGKDGKGVELGYAPLVHAGRILFRAGIVCSPSYNNISQDEADCRTKAEDYLQNCLEIDIDASVELVSITILVHQENSIPGVCPKEEEGYATLRLTKLVPVNLVVSKEIREAVGSELVSDMKARVKKNHFNADVLKLIQADGTAGKCGVCWKKNAVDVQITVLPVLLKGIVFMRCLLICEKEGTMGPCERKAKEYTKEKVELDFRVSEKEGFIGGWDRATVGEQCNQCGLRKQGMAKCAACKCAWYCSQACQKLHWKAHKGECFKMRLLNLQKI